MILLDTDIVVAHLRGNKKLINRIAERVDEISIPAIVLAELEYGARLSNRPTDNLKQLHNFINTVEIIPFDRYCAEKYAEIKAQLTLIGKMAGEVDVLIASIARAHSAVLVTHNLKHFEPIEKLKLEDWLA